MLTGFSDDGDVMIWNFASANNVSNITPSTTPSDCITVANMTGKMSV